jgi:hypothetical protein
MTTAPNRSRAIGWRERPLAFAAVALLAGCGTVARDAAVVRGATAPPTPGPANTVLFRVVPPPGASIFRPPMVSGQVSRIGGGFSADAVSRGWTGWQLLEGWKDVRNLPPGHYVLRVTVHDTPPPPPGREGTARRVSRSGVTDTEAKPLDVTFRILSDGPAVTYLGSFRLACETSSRPCRFDPSPIDESAAVLNAPGERLLATPVTALAQPYPPSIHALGLAPPSTPALRVDATQWVAAIDWEALFRANAGLSTPAPGPRSHLQLGRDAEMVLTSGVADGIGSALGAGAAAGGAAGGVLLLGAAAILVVAIPVALIMRAAEEQRRQRAEAEALQAAARAQVEWNPCTSAIAATLAPENVERHLQGTFAGAGGQRPAPPGPWEATVTRVVLRHCGTTPDSHGVEVATRWTATRPGEREPIFDAAFSRTVAGATNDPRLVHSARPPWEVPVATDAACRPLAAYCAPGGTALLLEEVVRGVTEARDAIAAGR